MLQPYSGHIPFFSGLTTLILLFTQTQTRNHTYTQPHTHPHTHTQTRTHTHTRAHRLGDLRKRASPPLFHSILTLLEAVVVIIKI